MAKRRNVVPSLLGLTPEGLTESEFSGYVPDEALSWKQEKSADAVNT